MNNKRWLVALFVSSSLMLSGCGGGSGNSTTPAAASTLTGTAATGAAIQNGIVTAKCSDGTGFTNPVTSDSNGKWTGTLNNASALPCALEVVYGTPAQKLHSYATSTGTVNITPLTDLALALAISQDPATWFTGFSGTPITNLSAQTSALLSSLATKGFDIPSTSANPFTTAFNANHTGWDRMLDQLQLALSNGGVNFQDLLNDVVTSGDIGAAMSALTAPTPFTISGTVSGATDKVHWSLWANGATYSGDAANGNVTFSPAEGIFEGSIFQMTITQPSNQSCILANQSGTLTGDVTNITITCENTTPPSPATVHTGLVGTYSLTYEQIVAGGPFTNGATVTASIDGDSLTLNGTTLHSPVLVDGTPNAIAWTDSGSGITYRVFNNVTGVFSEINLFNGSTFLGQLSEATAPGSDAVTAFSSLAGSYDPVVTNIDGIYGMLGGTVVNVQVSNTGVVTLKDLSFDPADSSLTFQDRADNAGHFYELNSSSQRLRVFLDTNNEPVYLEVKQGSNYLSLTTPMPADVTTFLDAIKAAGTQTLTVVANSAGTTCSTSELTVTGNSPNYNIQWDGNPLSYSIKTSIYEEGNGFASLIVSWGAFFRLTYYSGSGVLEVEALNKWPLNTAFTDPLTVTKRATTDTAAIADACPSP